MSGFFILDTDGKPQRATLHQWARWLDGARRTIRRTIINDSECSLLVSSVFLGVDHGGRPGLPLLYETMVFDQGALTQWDDYCARYATRAEVVREHERLVCTISSQWPPYAVPVVTCLEES